MTADVMSDLAAELTDRFSAIDGVRGIFPAQPVHTVALRLVGAPTVGRVHVEEQDGPLVIVARLATARAVPARAVIAAADSAAAEVVGSAGYELRLEFAFID